MLFGRTVIGTVAKMAAGLATPTPFVKSWSEMVQYNYENFLEENQRILYNEATVSYHSLARDDLVDNMRGDFILMLDTDITFEPDIVARMWNKMNKYNIDVLAGMYLFKGDVHAPVVYGYNPKTKERYILGDWQKGAEIMPLYSAGAGCLMIRKNVIAKVKTTGTSLFSIEEPFSEDNSFFRRLHKLKIPAYYSPSITVNHLIYRELSLEKDWPKEARNVRKVNTVVGYK